MELKVAFKYSLKRSEKVKTLPPKISVKLGNKNEATVDSYLLFPRLVVLPNGSNMKCKNIHQLCLDQRVKCKKQEIHL